MIDATVVREQERQLLTRRFDSDLGKTLAHQAKQLRGREADPVLAPIQEQEVVARIAAAGGDWAAQELAARLAEVEGRIANFAKNYGSGQASWPLRETLPMIRENVRLGRIYRARLAAIRAKQGGADPAPADPSGPTEFEEVHSVLLAAAGQRFIDDLRRNLEPAADELRTRLDQVKADLEADDAMRSTGRSPGGAHDTAWDRYAWLVWRRGDLEARIARLEQDRAKAKSVQAGLTKKAIDSGGGPDAVAKGVRDSWLMQRAFYEAHPDHRQMQAHSSAAGAVDAELAKLGGPDVDGPVAQSLKADRAAALAQAGTSKAAIEAEMKRRISGLIADAIAGDEVARATIEQAARTEPRAFASGFADAITNAQFERSQIGALIHSMLETSGIKIGS